MKLLLLILVTPIYLLLKLVRELIYLPVAIFKTACTMVRAGFNAKKMELIILEEQIKQKREQLRICEHSMGKDSSSTLLTTIRKKIEEEIVALQTELSKKRELLEK
jgi:hypothetical protein